MTDPQVNEPTEDPQSAHRVGGESDNDARSARRVLATYGALGSGPFGLLTALLGRAIESTRGLPEPWRRILWGQKR